MSVSGESVPFPGTAPALARSPAAVRSEVVAHRRVAREVARLRQLVWLATLGPVAGVLVPSDQLLMTDRLLCAFAWVLCMLPSVQYLTTRPSRRRPIPLLPLLGFQFGVLFVIQGVFGITNVYGRFQQEVYVSTLDPLLYAQPILLVLGGWTALLAGYAAIGTVIRRRPIDAGISVSVPLLVRWAFRLLFIGLAIDIARRFALPAVLGGVLTFGSNLTLMGVALLTIMLVRGQMSHRQRLTFLVGITLLLFFKLGTSASAAVVTLLMALLIAVWIGGGGRVSMRWVAVGLVGIAFFLSMRGVANEHRKAMDRAGGNLNIVDRSTLLVRLLETRIATEGVGQTVMQGWEAASARTALLDLFADVHRQTPSNVPYWGGETYLSLVGAVVPRFLWPDKPKKTLGWAFGQRYGYLSQDDFTTTINFPFLIEFYANFGSWAVLVGMLLVGAIYRSVEGVLNVPGQGPLVSSAALVLLLPMLSIESDFSLLFGGLFLYGGALWATYRIIILTTRRRGRPVAAS